MKQNSISQCTGLKDRRYIIIYAKDIVKNKDDNKIGIIEWIGGAWHVEWKDTIEYLDKSNNSIYVIGNYFDNPELLEGVFV